MWRVTHFAFAVLAVMLSGLMAYADDTRTRAFDSRVGALKVHPSGADMQPPVVRLGSGRLIEVSFDMIGDDRRIRVTLLCIAMPTGSRMRWWGANILMDSMTLRSRTGRSQVPLRCLMFTIV